MPHGDRGAAHESRGSAPGARTRRDDTYGPQGSRPRSHGLLVICSFSCLLFAPRLCASTCSLSEAAHPSRLPRNGVPECGREVVRRDQLRVYRMARRPAEYVSVFVARARSPLTFVAAVAVSCQPGIPWTTNSNGFGGCCPSPDASSGCPLRTDCVSNTGLWDNGEESAWYGYATRRLATLLTPTAAARDEDVERCTCMRSIYRDHGHHRP